MLLSGARSTWRSSDQKHTGDRSSVQTREHGTVRRRVAKRSPPAYARNLLPSSLISRALQGDVTTIDLVVGYSKTNTSPILKLFRSRIDDLIARVSKNATQSSLHPDFTQELPRKLLPSGPQEAPHHLCEKR